MVGIAVIFDALTAEDRPYKKDMSLAQVLSIFERFRRNGHIDPELHEVFVKIGVPELRRGFSEAAAGRLLKRVSIFAVASVQIDIHAAFRQIDMPQIVMLHCAITAWGLFVIWNKTCQGYE